MKKEAKVVIQKPEAPGLTAIEKRKQPEVLPKSNPGTSSKSTASKKTDRKRPEQDIDALYSINTTSQPSTSTYCSPFSEPFSDSSEASEKSDETSKKPVENSKKPVPPTESKSSEGSKKGTQTPKKPRQPSKCPYCPVIMTRTNDLRKHVKKFHQQQNEMLCHMCDFRCNDIVTHLAHENDHLCKCPYCGYITKNYRGLPRHKTFCRLNPEYEESNLSKGGVHSAGKETKKKE